MLTRNYDLNEIFAVTTKYIDDNVQRVWELTTPLHTAIMKKKRYVDGGNRLTVALDFDKNNSIGFITGTSADLLNVNPQQNLKPAELDWKYLYSNFSVTLQDLNTTADSKHSIISLVTMKAENTIASIRQFLSTAFYGSAVDDPNAFNGFGDIFAASGTSYAGLVDTDMGVDAAGDKIWLPQIDNSTSTISYAGINKMMTKLKTKAASSGKENTLDFMVSKPEVLSVFKETQQAQQRFIDVKDLEAGFDAIRVNGVTWFADDNCPGSGTAYKLYLINSGSMKFFYKYGFEGKDSPQDVSGLRLPNQPIMVHQKFYTGNLFCVNRRVNGVFNALNPNA